MAFSRLLSYWVVNVLIAVVLIGGTAAALAQRRLFRPEPPVYYVSDEDHFLFGSVGSEETEGIPYWLWLVLPRVFPEYFSRPGGYAALGFVSKDGHEMPVGLSRSTIGFPRVGVNCAACHTARYRRDPDDVPTIVPAAPAHQGGPQEYLQFLFNAASDPRFTADRILAEIARNHELSLLDRLFYRFAIIPGTRTALLAQKAKFEWMRKQPPWGRGRIDPLNPVKFTFLRQPIDSTIGASDMVPVWNLKAHAGYPYHWDGLATDLTEVTRSSALATGATRDWIDRDTRSWDDPDPKKVSSLRRIQNYMTAVPPPKYPLQIDATLVPEGQRVFDATCASCHAPGGTRTGQVIPVSEVGTDSHRVDEWTEQAAQAFNAYGDGRNWQFKTFRKTNGYVARPLDGIWLRAPYLHNGSVPTLMDLLTPVASRPVTFWRGYDLLDSTAVGFISSGPDAERMGMRFDTSMPGNGNAGHLYGTDLPPDSKLALIEYLKTL